MLRSEIVKFTPKNYIKGCRIWEDLFLTENIIFARSVSFTTPSVPQEELRDGQSQGGPGRNHPAQTCYTEARLSLEAAALRSHISLLSHALTLQSHCSSINLQHPAIWSPSSHSDTQTPLSSQALTSLARFPRTRAQA